MCLMSDETQSRVQNKPMKISSQPIASLKSTTIKFTPQPQQLLKVFIEIYTKFHSSPLFNQEK